MKFLVLGKIRQTREQWSAGPNIDLANLRGPRRFSRSQLFDTTTREMRTAKAPFSVYHGASPFSQLGLQVETMIKLLLCGNWLADAVKISALFSLPHLEAASITPMLAQKCVLFMVAMLGG